MAHMIRKQVYIEPRQDAILKRLARTLGLTEAEVIRRAIDREAELGSSFMGHPDSMAWEEARGFIQAWIDQGVVAGERTWKREDVYEERLSRYGRKGAA